MTEELNIEQPLNTDYRDYDGQKVFHRQIDGKTWTATGTIIKNGVEHTRLVRPFEVGEASGEMINSMRMMEIPTTELEAAVAKREADDIRHRAAVTLPKLADLPQVTYYEEPASERTTPRSALWEATGYDPNTESFIEDEPKGLITEIPDHIKNPGSRNN